MAPDAAHVAFSFESTTGATDGVGVAVGVGVCVGVGAGDGARVGATVTAAVDPSLSLVGEAGVLGVASMTGTDFASAGDVPVVSIACDVFVVSSLSIGVGFWRLASRMSRMKYF